MRRPRLRLVQDRHDPQPFWEKQNSGRPVAPLRRHDYARQGCPELSERLPRQQRRPGCHIVFAGYKKARQQLPAYYKAISHTLSLCSVTIQDDIDNIVVICFSRRISGYRQRSVAPVRAMCHIVTPHLSGADKIAGRPGHSGRHELACPGLVQPIERNVNDRLSSCVLFEKTVSPAPNVGRSTKMRTMLASLTFLSAAMPP